MFVTQPLMAQAGVTRHRHALLIAPGTYAPESGWSSTTGESDLLQFRRSLARHGFDTLKRVRMLRASAATSDGMRSALSALLRDVSPGDVVQIYFSGHGARIIDDDGDEADGYDEALAGWDAPVPGRQDKDLELSDRYLRDDIWWIYIDSLRRKLTAAGNVSLFLDAGFLRTSCMGNAVVRGGAVPLATPGYQPAAGRSSDPDALFTEGGDGSLPETGRAPWMVISAAGGTGCSMEWREGQRGGVGVLTAALVRCIDRLPAGLSGQGFFRQLQTVMHRMMPGQLPVAEGDALERPFWGGLYVASGPDVAVTRIEKDGSLRLEAGWSTGWSDSSRVVVYRTGTKPGPGVRPLATGIITQSSSESCRVIGTRIPPEIPASQLRVYLTEPAWLRTALALGFVRNDRDPGADEASAYFDPAEIQTLKDRLSDVKYLSFSAAPEWWLRKAKRGYELLHGASGRVFFSMTSEGELADHLPGAMRSFITSAMLQRVPSFTAANPPVNLQALDEPTIPMPQAYDQLKTIAMQVVNPFEAPMYVNLLELSPDGGIRALIPAMDSRSAAEEWVVAPRSTRTFAQPGESFRLDGLPGIRTFVWFMSPTPIDLRPRWEGPGAPVASGRLTGFNQLATFDEVHSAIAVRVPESQGLSGLIHLRVLPVGPGR